MQLTTQSCSILASFFVSFFACLTAFHISLDLADVSSSRCLCHLMRVIGHPRSYGWQYRTVDEKSVQYSIFFYCNSMQLKSEYFYDWQGRRSNFLYRQFATSSIASDPKAASWGRSKDKCSPNLNFGFSEYSHRSCSCSAAAPGTAGLNLWLL